MHYTRDVDNVNHKCVKGIIENVKVQDKCFHCSIQRMRLISTHSFLHMLEIEQH